MEKAQSNMNRLPFAQKEDQLASINAAITSLDQLAVENQDIQDLLALRQESFNRLYDLSLATAQLISAVSSNIPEAAESSLQCLSKLNKSSAIVPTQPEETNTNSIIGGKYLNQILALINEFAQQPNPNLITAVELEQRLNQVFEFAEKKEIIPPVPEDQSWKLLRQKHIPLYNKINALGQEEESSEEKQDNKQ